MSTGSVTSASGSSWTSVSGYYASQAAASGSAPSNQLDKNAFLKLMVAQLQNQDPTSPVNSTDFIAQLAQFSSLEQMTNVSSGMQSVGQSSSLGVAVELIGKQVTALDDSGNPLSGTVTGMTVNNGAASVLIGKQAVDISRITSVTT